MNDMPHLLVVDHDPQQREATARMLRRAGYPVQQAASGPQGARLAAEQQPALILVNLALPDQGALALCRQSQPGSMVLLLHDAGADSNDVTLGLEQGAAGAIARPFPEREFLARVAAFGRLRGAHDRETPPQVQDPHSPDHSDPISTLPKGRCGVDENGMLEALMNAPQHSIALLDREGTILRINESGARWLGSNQEALIGRRVYDLFSPALRRRRNAQVQQVIQEGRAVHFEDHRAGMHLENSIYPVFGEGGSEVTAVAVFSRDITERREAEKAQRKRDAQYRFLAENTGDIVALYQGGHDPVYISPASERVLGYTYQELIGMPLGELVPPEDRQVFLQRIEDDVQAGERHSRYEYRVRHKKGHHIWLESISTRDFDEDGNLRQTQVTTRDITQRKQVEEALRHSQERLWRLVDNMPVMVDAFDEEQNLVLWNKECERVTGYSAQEMLGNPKALEMLYPDESYRARMQSKWERRFDSFVNWELELTCKDGSKRTIAWSSVSRAVPISGWQSWAVGVDVTQRKQAEARQAFLAHVLEAVEQAVIVTDREGRVVYWNPFAQELYGWSAEEALGRTTLELIATDRSMEHGEEIMAHLQRGDSWLGEYQVRHRDGTIFTIHCTTTPILDASGAVKHIAGVSHAVSLEDLAWEELQASEERFRRQFVSVPVPAFIWQQVDQHVVLLEFNAAAEALTPGTAQGFLGMTAEEIYDDRPDLVESLATSLREQRVIVVETDYHTRGTRTDRSIVFTCSPLSPDLVMLYAQDVTERDVAAQTLRESEREYEVLNRLLRAITDNMTDMLWAKDMNQRYIFANRAICQNLLNARDTQEPIGKNDMFFAQRERDSHPDEPQWHTFGEICRDSDQVVIETRSPGQFDEFGNVKGEFLFLDVLKSPLYNERGEMVGVVGSARDVTREKEMVRRLEQSETRLEQQVRDRTRELEALYAIARISSQNLDLHTTLTRALECIMATMNCQLGAIHLPDKALRTQGEVEEPALRLAVRRGIPPQVMAQREQVPPGSGLIGQVWQHGEPIIVSDLSQDPRLYARGMPHELSGAYAFVPLRAARQIVGVLTIGREKTEPPFTDNDTVLLITMAKQLGIVVESARLRERVEQSAVQEERARLARELHDSVTQALYSLTLLAETGRKAATGGDLATVELCLAPLGETAQQALKEMRLLVYELRPPVLKEAGLVGALQQRLDAVEARTGIERRLVLEGDVHLSSTQEDHLYRIALEALNNALKHAAAQTVTVRLETEGNEVGLLVEDDGRGFDPTCAADSGGMGLDTMRERAQLLNGTLTVRSQPGQGTMVAVRFSRQGTSPTGEGAGTA